MVKTIFLIIQLCTFFLNLPQTVNAQKVGPHQVIIDSHQLALEVIRQEKIAPPLAAFTLALANTTAFEVLKNVNNIKLGYKAAFVHILKLTNSTQTNYLDQKIVFNNLSISDKLDYLKAKKIAEKFYHSHKNNLQQATNPYYVNEILKPGIWRPTPPLLQPALLPKWGIIKLWSNFLKINETLNSVYPPQFNSEVAKKEILHIYNIGGTDSRYRTKEESDIAKFWMGSPGTATPPGQWIIIATERLKSTNISFINAAKVMLALTQALSDAGCLAWKIKYNFNTWRPVSAIQFYFKDNVWKPYINTPPFPGYISGHSTFSSAAATILSVMLPLANSKLVVTSEDLPNQKRIFNSYMDAAKEAGMSRLFGGIHVQADNVDGLKIGKKIACANLLELINFNCSN